VVNVWLSPSGLKPLRLTQFGTVATIFNTIAILISTLDLVRPPPQVCFLPKFKVITWLPTKTDPKPLMLFPSSRPAGTTYTVRYASYASSCTWINQREARTGNRLMLPA
jgi:hypothetical protein